MLDKGVCTSALVCPSSTSKRSVNRYEGSGSCSVMGSGWMACGVSGGSGRAFECVNTANDLESCELSSHYPFSRLRTASDENKLILDHHDPH